MNDEQRSREIRDLEALVEGAAGAMAFPILAEAHRRAGRPEQAERVARDGLARAPQASSGRVALALALLDQKRSDEARAELEWLLGSEAEHAIAHDEAAREEPEGVASGETAGEIVGELASLEPYAPASAYGIAGRDDDAPDPDDDDARDPAPRADEAPASLAQEPAEAGPFGPPPPPAPAEPLVFGGGDVADDELDDAFDQAESRREEMFGADDVAQAALAAVPEEDGDGLAEADPSEPSEPHGAHAIAGRASPFATETVAGLLERQGHRHEAERIRAQLDLAEAAEAARDDAGERGHPEEPGGEGVHPHEHKATLERWLDNLRRDRG